MGWLLIPEVRDEEFNKSASLPSGLSILDIKNALVTLYKLLHELNCAAVNAVGLRLEELMRPNSFPDFISHVLVLSIAQLIKPGPLTENMTVFLT